jgi:hypothetical protein
VPKVRQTSSSCEANITGTDDCDFERHVLRLARFFTQTKLLPHEMAERSAP